VPWEIGIGRHLLLGLLGGHHTWRVIDGGGNSRNCSVARPTSSDLLGEVRLVDSITDNVYRGVGVGVRGANFG